MQNLLLFVKIGICSLVLLCAQTIHAVENYRYFMEAQSLSGPTGNIKTMSTKTLSYKQFSFGLHRFFIGLNYGIFPDIETGVSFDLKNMTSLSSINQENIDRKSREISFYSKYRILKEEKRDLLDISVGQRRERFYLIFGKFFEPLWNSTLQGGVSWEREKLLTFFSFSQSQSTEQFILDYEPKEDIHSLGWRFLLSPEIKLDFFMTDFTRIKNIFFDNFVFGITIVR